MRSEREQTCEVGSEHSVISLRLFQLVVLRTDPIQRCWGFGGLLGPNQDQGAAKSKKDASLRLPARQDEQREVCTVAATQQHGLTRVESDRAISLCGNRARTHVNWRRKNELGSHSSSSWPDHSVFGENQNKSLARSRARSSQPTQVDLPFANRAACSLSPRPSFPTNLISLFDPWHADRGATFFFRFLSPPSSLVVSLSTLFTFSAPRHTAARP
ncbi:hypothetical protein VTG60DRAFT_5621 [Thermothelomyces hinnuleus]